VIEMLGPSSIPPLVTAKSLDPALKQRLREVLLTMHNDSTAAQVLHAGQISRFVAVDDARYDDIRAMFDLVQSGEAGRV
jgi:phosphonate transport system substrate-binding protein